MLLVGKRIHEVSQISRAPAWRRQGAARAAFHDAVAARRPRASRARTQYPRPAGCPFDGSFSNVADRGAFAFSLDDNVNHGIGIYRVLGSGSLVAYSGTGTNGTVLNQFVADGQRFKAGLSWSGSGAAAKAGVAFAAARLLSMGGPWQGDPWVCRLWLTVEDAKP